MNEAGRLAELQAELRSEGIPFDVVLAPYQGTDREDPTIEENAELAELVTDPTDPDRNFPVVLTDFFDLASVMPMDGSYPKHCLLGPDRSITWCLHGHGKDPEVATAARELWAELTGK